MKIRRAWRMLAWGGCLAASAAAAGPQAVETEPGPGARAVRVVGQPGDSPAALRAASTSAWTNCARAGSTPWPMSKDSPCGSGTRRAARP